MAKEIVIPKLGMTMTSAKIGQWKAEEGQWVEAGQVVLVIETEKVTYDVEALEAGFLHILAQTGDVLDVGVPAALLAADEAELKKLQAGRPAPAAGLDSGPEEESPAQDQGPEPSKRERIFVTPVARKMARENNLDLTRVKGTGPGGRIKRIDVEKALAEGPRKPASAEVVKTEETGRVIDGKRVRDSLPLSGIRGVIAEHMRRSLDVSAQLTSMGEFEVEELVRMRNSLLAQEAALGTRVSYTDILVFILARALKENPIINSSLVGDEIVLWEDVNIGVAVSLPWEQYDAGLIVPVLKNADRKSLVEISFELKDLRARASAGTLGLEDIMGGTFTLSNVGGFGKGYSYSTPIINQPQAAILLTGAIVDRALVKDGQVVPCPTMNWAVTFDHRIINGAPIGKFIGRVAELLASPYLLLT